MGEGVALHIGAVDFTWGELRWFAVAALAAGVVPFGQWARWQLRAWRIRRAIARSDYDHADLLALNQDEEEGPRSLRGLLTGIAFILIVILLSIVVAEMRRVWKTGNPVGIEQAT